MAVGDQAVRGELSGLRVIGTTFCKLLIQLVREIFQFSGKIQKTEKIPETPGCSNHVKVPLWSTLLLCIAEFRLYLVMTWDEFKSKFFFILRINCNANGTLKWKIKLSPHSRRSYCTPCSVFMGVYSECQMLLLIFSVKGNCIIQVPFQYLTDT